MQSTQHVMCHEMTQCAGGQGSCNLSFFLKNDNLHQTVITTPPTPQLFYGPFSGTTRVSRLRTLYIKQ